MHLWVVLIGCGFIWPIPKVKCQECSTDCQSCTFDGTLNICTSCIDGYWPAGYACLPCSNNCDTCSDASSCSTCKSGLYAPSTCHLQCSTNCLNGLCEENTGYCIECPSERYGHQCDFECELCKNEQCDLRHCTNGCKSEYWQYQDGNYTECKPCVDNCVSCVNGSICNVCKDGTYLSKYSETRNYCVPCFSTCEKCSKIISCSACKAGYYGSSCEYMCFAKLAGCLICEEDSALTVTCSQCDNGLILQDNKCVEDPNQCLVNCEICSGDNLCEMCKTGWVGTLCDKACQDITHCVACHEKVGSIVCNVCDEGYEVMNGECSATSTSTTTIQSPSTPSTQESTKKTTVRPILTTPTTTSTKTTIAQQTSTTSTPVSTITLTSNASSISDPPVCECSTPMPQSQNTRFQTRAFVIGLFTGIGICICAILLTVLVWFLRRRIRLQKSTTSRQNEPFYENSLVANESHSTTMNSGSSIQENIQQMRIVEENDREPGEDIHQTPVDGESVSTSTYIDQHDYTSLNVRHGEHIYKDLTV